MFIKNDSNICPNILTIEPNEFANSFQEKHFVSNDDSLYESIKKEFTYDFDEFREYFSKLQHFPEFPHVDEGIEICVVNINKQTIEPAAVEKNKGYVAQGTLQDLPYKNRFLKHLLLNICKPLAFYSNNLHVGLKFHRRTIEKGNTEQVQGLKPHKDYDSEIIVMMKIEQHNISGGRNQITDEFQTVLTEDSMPSSGSITYVNNEKLFHELTPMHLTEPLQYGFRDVMILEIKKDI